MSSDTYGLNENGPRRTLAGAAARGALAMMSGLVLIVAGAATCAMVAPQSVRSSAFSLVSAIVVEAAQFLTAVWAGAVTWRRVPGRPGVRRYLWAMVPPVAVVLAVDVTAFAAWWRLLLDLAVTASGAALYAVRKGH